MLLVAEWKHRSTRTEKDYRPSEWQRQGTLVRGGQGELNVMVARRWAGEWELATVIAKEEEVEANFAVRAVIFPVLRNRMLRALKSTA